jgi:hypothetical protein
LFSLFINEFDRIFREIDDTDEAEAEPEPVQPDPTARSRARSDSSSGRARRRSRNSTLFMQSGADRLLESLNDQENNYNAEEPISDAQYIDHERQGAGFKSNASKPSEEDTTIRQRPHHQQQQNRHQLTIDIISAPSPARPSGTATRDRNEYQAQKSPSGHSSIATPSPRMLYPDNPLRSPGVAPPISPRHANRAPS